MSAAFERKLQALSESDLASFRALCLHRADAMAAPYSALLAAPDIAFALTAHPLVHQTCDETVSAIEEIYRTEGGSGAEYFARALGRVLEGPGRIPGLISIGFHERWDCFELNIARERGGALDSTYTGSYGCGLTMDTYHTVSDAFGPHSSITFSVDYLTEEGVEFAHWLLPVEIEALRAREQNNVGRQGSR